MIKVYEGANQVVNDAVRHWLSFVGAKVYPYEYGDCTMCELKRTLVGGRQQDCVVEGKKKAMVVYTASMVEREQFYDYMGIKKDMRRED